MRITLKDIEAKANTSISYAQGELYYKNRQVDALEVKITGENEVTLESHVHYEAGTYCTKAEIIDHHIEWCECECMESFQHNGACRHVVAMLLKYYYEAIPKLRQSIKGERYSKEVLNYYEDQLIKDQDLKAGSNETISLIPKIIEEGQGDYNLSLSVGSKKFYIVKDVYDFAEHILNGDTVSYGKNLEFMHDISAFQEKVRPLVQFILDKTTEYMELLKQVGMFRGFTKADRKTLPLGARAFDEFFDLIKDSEIEFVKEGKSRKVQCIEGNPKMEFRVEQQEDDNYHIVTSLEDYVPFAFSHYKYILLPDKLYRLSEDFGRDVYPLLLGIYDAKGIQGGKKLEFDQTLMKRFMVSSLDKIEKHLPVLMSEEIKTEIAPQKVKIKVYFDLDEEGCVIGEVKFCYNELEFNPYKLLGNRENKLLQSIARDVPREYAFNAILRNYEFRTHNGGLYLKDEDNIYRFLHEGLIELMDLCEVHVTERLKKVNIIKSPVESIGLKIENNMLHLALGEVSMPLDEVKEILEAYKQKSKYYRLRNGSFVDVQEGVKELAHIVQGLAIDPDELSKGEIDLPQYRVLYLDQILKEGHTIKVDRDKYFKQIVRDMKSIEDGDFDIPKGLRASLRSYQKVGYRWLRTLAQYGFGGILADDMGLGKTLQIIAVFLAEQEEKVQNENPKASLVVCPTSLILNWLSEIKRFAPSLSAKVISGSADERICQIKGITGEDIIITSYQSLKRDIEYYKKLNFRYCIADEAQYIKNAMTQSAHALKSIRSDVRFALTGTPIENSLAELWSIFDFIMPEYLFSYTKFKRDYETMIVKNHEEEATMRLKKLIAPFILRRLKKEVLKELPDKTETVVYNTMEDMQRKLYVANLMQAKAELEHEIDQKGMNKSHIKMLALLTRLRQLCCHPSLYLQNYHETSGKLEQCIEIVKDSIAAGHKILLFSQFTSMLDILSRRLTEEGIQHFILTGATQTEERMHLVSEFNTNEVPVFLISLKAGGTGLNLTGADVVIHYDPWWNLSSQNQATDRAYRIGQQRKVQVFQMITKDSIEEKIKKLQDQKIGLTESVLQEGEAFISRMSEEEIRELFSL